MPAARYTLSQDARLYQHLSVADTLHLARNMNVGWDQRYALTVALAKRPRLLLLDEPLAWLDPLARHDFLAALMAAVAEDGLSVVFSSHILAELERVADYLILLSRGRVQVAGDVEHLLSCHRVLTGPADGYPPHWQIVHTRRAGLQAQLLVRIGGPLELPPGWQPAVPAQEELVLAYLREPGVSALPGPAAPEPAGQS